MSLLSKKFFDLLPSSVEFSEEIKDYITGLIDDLDSNNNNETDLREVTEQFLVDAGIPKNDIEKLYIDLAANNIVKNSDNDKELEKLSNKILNKINQISNKETKTNTNNINSNVDKKSKKQLINTASTNDDSKKTAVEEVDLKDVNVIVGDKELLVDAHVKFKTGVHYGLIGRNGVGKSTFLKSIGYNKLVGFPKNIRVLYIEQLESVEEKTTVLETVVKADKERTRLLHEKQILQNAIESNEIKKIEFAVKSVNLEKLQMDLDLSRKIAIQRSGRRGLDARQDLVNVEAKVEEAQNALKSLGQDQSVDYTAIIHEMLEEVYTKLDQIKADSAEARAQEILVGLGFSDKLQHSPISSLSSLSGGTIEKASIVGQSTKSNSSILTSPILVIISKLSSLLSIFSTSSMSPPSNLSPQCSMPIPTPFTPPPSIFMPKKTKFKPETIIFAELLVTLIGYFILPLPRTSSLKNRLLDEIDFLDDDNNTTNGITSHKLNQQTIIQNNFFSACHQSSPASDIYALVKGNQNQLSLNINNTDNISNDDSIVEDSKIIVPAQHHQQPIESINNDNDISII
ncbi:15058_t:CDS:10, partial [Entrophospora sp. SA101]